MICVCFTHFNNSHTVIVSIAVFRSRIDTTVITVKVSIAFFSSCIDTTVITVKVSIAIFKSRLDTTFITVCKSRYVSSDRAVNLK